MSLELEDLAIMGMGIESVQVRKGGFEILTPGAEVTLEADGMLTVQQLIGVKRKLFSCLLSSHLAPWRLSRWTPFRCVLTGNGLTLTIQGDSVLIFAPQQHMKLTFNGYFKLQYAQEVRGNRLLLDTMGGCGFFNIPRRPTEFKDLKDSSWNVGYHLTRWDELWVSVCPPRPRDEEKYYLSIAHEGGSRGSLKYLYPSNELIRSAAKHCQIFTVHSGWEIDAPEWSENPPGGSYPHPRPWETDRHIPANPNEFFRVRDEAHRLGMKFIPYLSPLYSNAPDVFAEMERVLREYEVDGLYLDGWICGPERDDFRPGYYLMRRARAILGDRLLYLHSSMEPYGTCRVYLPFVYAYADFVLSGENSRFGLGTEEFLQYTVRQHQISNSVGMWCYYGSCSDEPGYGAWIDKEPVYQFNVPTSEHIEMALSKHIRFWRTEGEGLVGGGGWHSFPEELTRFDREYYGRLARLRAENK